MEEFLALKCTVVTELFYVTIYTQLFTIWFNGKWSKQLAICNIYSKTFKKVL